MERPWTQMDKPRCISEFFETLYSVTPIHVWLVWE